MKYPLPQKVQPSELSLYIIRQIAYKYRLRTNDARVNLNFN